MALNYFVVLALLFAHAPISPFTLKHFVSTRMQKPPPLLVPVYLQSLIICMFFKQKRSRTNKKKQIRGSGRTGAAGELHPS